MSRTLAIISKMRELGIPEASILAVVEVAEAAAPRTSAAIRQARYRAKKEAEKAESVTRDVTRDVTNVTPIEASSRARSLCEEVVIKNKTPNGVLQKGTRILPDWTPDADGWAFAIAEVGRPTAERELAKFRDYWIGKPGAAGRKTDWASTWRNWIRKAADSKPRAGPNGSDKVSMLDVFNEIGRSDEPDYLTPDYSVGGFNDPPNVARIGSGAVRR